MKKVLMIAGAAALCGSSFAINVALGKTVTASGHFGELRPASGWEPPGPLAPFSSLTDGVYLPEGSVWHHHTIWWDAAVAGSGANTLTIDFAGLFRLTSAVLQADNNDSYGLEFRDAGGVWHGLGAFGPIAGFGMTTRGIGGAPIEATAMRISAFGGDGFYSVSEFEAHGVSVPEPFTMVLSGAAGVMALRRRLRAKRTA
jgi:hypothetical protein